MAKVDVDEQVRNAWYLFQRGEQGIAGQLLQDLLKSWPRNFNVLHLLGIVLLKQGQYDQALIHLQKAVKVEPSSPDVYNTLGETYRLSGHPGQAASHYRQALKLRPEYPEALLGLARLLDLQDKSGEALEFVERALKINPAFVEGLCKQGYLLTRLGKLPEAVAGYDKALTLNPDLPGPQRDRALLLKLLGRHQEAEAAFRRILAAAPDNAEIHYYLAMTLLAQGKLREGWEEYEWRWRWSEFPSVRRPFPQPEWAGDDIGECTLLVYGEQGIGDEVTFASLLPDAIARAGNCIVECEPRLVALFSRSFPAAAIVAKTDPPDPRTLGADVQSPINSLARWLRPDVQSFPSVGGWLKADPARVRFWRERLARPGGGMNVGISWRSRLRNAHRNAHYMEVGQLAPLIRIPGVNWINLQYDECSEELEQLRQLHGVEIRQFDDIDLTNDLDDVAALMSVLDLVVSPNTSVSLLAGALQVPVWQFNVKNVNWHNMGTDRWPGFPGMKVFYREWGESWDEVVHAMAEALVSFRNEAKRT